MQDNSILYVKENIGNIVVGFLCSIIIGVLTIYFVICIWDVLEIKQLKDLFSLLPLGQLLLGIVGVISCVEALFYFVKLIYRPYIKLSPNGINGNAIRKSVCWDEISEIKIVEMPKWYFRLLQSLVGASARPSRLSVSYRLINDFENESFQKGFAKICIIDKMGNKHIISLENGYMIKEKIIDYIHDNHINFTLLPEDIAECKTDKDSSENKQTNINDIEIPDFLKKK